MTETADKAYSVFISKGPYNRFTEPQFMYLCSDASIDYSLNYSSSVTGMLGRGPEQAIFVDGAAGSVATISISGIRCNPATSTQSHDVGSQPSNADFYWEIRRMLTTNQMFQNAYILRLYNVDWSDVNSYTEHRDLYVHISKNDLSWTWTDTNDANITMSCYRRNKTEGFGDQ